MDFPVEATVHLSAFHNETQAREILRSHDFALTDLSHDQVRVRGSFLRLGAAKASLETLLNSQTKKDTAASSSSPVPKVSSGAISKYYTTRSDTNRSRSRSWSKHAPSPPTFPWSLMTGSSSNRPTSPKRSSFSPTPDQRSSPRAGEEVFVDADVFDYAERLRRKDLDSILDCHNVIRRAVHPVSDSYIITLEGRSAGKSVGKLQSLLDDLNKSLRTQEVPLRDMNPEGRALFRRIQKKKNIYGSVLVRPEEGKLHLIGPSGESYELKQRLLGRPVDRSGRTGRTLDRNARGRSSSLPPITRKSTERDGGVGATGHIPSKYQELKQEVAEPKQEAAAAAAPLSGPVWRRSHSESRNRNPAGRTPGKVQDTQTKDLHPKTPIKARAQLLLFQTTDDIKQMFKKRRK